MNPPEPRVEIVNIVATMKLEPLPDPGEILERIPGARPLKRFKGAMIRIDKKPVLFYRSKVVVTGAKSIEDLDNLIEKLVETLRRHGFTVKPVSREIVNVTARAELGVKIDLRKAAEKLNGVYDPDYRPYLIARINNTPVILTHNGKIVILGTESIEQVKELVDFLVAEIFLANLKV